MGKAVESDEDLMAHVAVDRRECMGPLIRRCANPLLTFIRRMISDEHRSEELFQEVFLAVWKQRAEYQFPRSFRAWLYGIALNHCRAEFRRAPPRSLPLDGFTELAAASRGPSPAEAAIARETETLVQAAISRLPLQQRTVVVLRLCNGLSYFEIAEVLSRSEGTVRSHMAHALAALKNDLAPRLK